VADNRPVVILISEDPRVSHRANEAMRIGLGIVAGENEVVFVLRGPAVQLLAEDTDELVDGDDTARFRTNLKSLGVPFHIEADAMPSEPTWNPERHPVIAVTREEIAGLVGRSRRVLVF